MSRSRCAPSIAVLRAGQARLRVAGRSSGARPLVGLGGCQWSFGFPRWRKVEIPEVGRWLSPLAAGFVAGWGLLGKGFDALAVGGFGESEAVAFGDEDVRVVQEPIDGGRGEGFGHDLVESSRVQV
jgi:hypothetical protein